MRPTRDQINMESAILQAMRGKCYRGVCGCVITKDGRILSSGYNGSIIHDLDCGKLRCDLNNNCEHSAHAEENAIAFAACAGISLKDTIMYITVCPCYKCARLIKQAGIKEVVYLEEYSDPRGMVLLYDSGIIVRQFQKEKLLHV